MVRSVSPTFSILSSCMFFGCCLFGHDVLSQGCSPVSFSPVCCLQDIALNGLCSSLYFPQIRTVNSNSLLELLGVFTGTRKNLEPLFCGRGVSPPQLHFTAVKI